MYNKVLLMNPSHKEAKEREREILHKLETRSISSLKGSSKSLSSEFSRINFDEFEEDDPELMRKTNFKGMNAKNGEMKKKFNWELGSNNR